MAVFARAGTPQTVFDVLQQHIVRIMDLPDVKQRIDTMGFDPQRSSPSELVAFMKAETAKWSKVLRDVNIKIE
jgi:tripartite-type tricarboxylate transporter receptor subunit TctC